MDQQRLVKPVRVGASACVSSTLERESGVSDLWFLIMATVTEEVAPAVAQEPAPEEAKGVMETPEKVEEGKKPEEGVEGKKAAAEKEKKARKPRSRKPKSAGPHHPPYFEVSKDRSRLVVRSDDHAWSVDGF